MKEKVADTLIQLNNNKVHESGLFGGYEMKLLNNDDLKNIETKKQFIMEMSNILNGTIRVECLPENIKSYKKIELSGVMSGIELLYLFQNEIELTYSQTMYFIDYCFYSVMEEKCYITKPDFHKHWYYLDNHMQKKFKRKVAKIEIMFLTFLEEIKKSVYNNYETWKLNNDTINKKEVLNGNK